MLMSWTCLDWNIFLSIFLCLFPSLKVTEYLQKKFAELGSPNKMKVSMGHGAKAWVSDFNHPHYIAGRKAMKTGTRTVTLRSINTGTERLSQHFHELMYYFNLFCLFITTSPCPCCVPQFLVWNRIWHVRVAAFQSPWPSRRPQDATSCCFRWDHLTMERTPRMKRSTGILSLAAFSLVCKGFTQASPWPSKGNIIKENNVVFIPGFWILCLINERFDFFEPYAAIL